MPMIARLTVKVLGWVGVERKVWDRRQWAAQEAANLMEQITSRPFRRHGRDDQETFAFVRGEAIASGRGAQGRNRRERSGRRSGVKAGRTPASLARPVR